MTITIKKMTPYPDLSNAALVSHLKYLYPNEPASALYGRFVSARDLRPNIDMKEFIPLYDAHAAREQCTIKTVEYHATHKTQAGRECMITGGLDFPGKVYLIFGDGGTGTELLTNLTELSHSDSDQPNEAAQ